MLSLTTLLGALLAFLLSAGVIWLMGPIARRIGLLDHPGGRKQHHKPTPMTGGIGIAIGVSVAAAFIFGPAPQFISLGISGLMLVTMGMWDDVKDLPWPFRMAVQIAAALILIYVGGVRVEQLGPLLGLKPSSLGSLSVPFTVAATVGLINALNMVDGVDGLAGSMVLCAVVMLISGAIYSGNAELAQFLTLVAAAVAAFLVFNLRLPWQRRAKAFLGDSGSNVLGLILAWSTFRLTQNPAHPVTPLLAPFLIAPPVIDCLVLMARRMAHGRSPFSADRTHLHHLLLDSGASVTEIVVGLSLFSMVLGLLAAVALLINIPHPVLLGSYMAMTVGYFVMTADRRRAIGVFRRLRGAVVPAEAKNAEVVELAE